MAVHRAAIELRRLLSLRASIEPKIVMWTRSKMPSWPGEFHPEPLTDPDRILSHHPARATARRLPPSVERRAPPGEPVGPKSTAMARPLRSTTITAASTLLQGSPPLSGASVLSALRLGPLGPFPLASPIRFSRSLQRAWLSFAPSTCRMSLGQYQDIHRTDPEGRVNPRF